MEIHKKLLKLRERENQVTGQILEALQVMEDQRGYLKLGYSSLFIYLVQGLKYSESTAYQRQSCLRLARDIPDIKEKIDKGTLSFSTVSMAYKAVRNKPVEVKKAVLKSIENKSAREVKNLLLEPAKPVKIKQQKFAEKVILRLEFDHKTHNKLEKLKALKSHRHDLESLFLELIEKELKTYENTLHQPSKSKNPRQISRRLRNAVLERGKYKCQYKDCQETHFLQIDHIVPVRAGGRPTPDNLQVLCGAHNRMKG